MTKLLQKLSTERAEIASVLNRAATKGVWESIVDKYSDQAHFIYELLQNADDVSATSAKFILDEKGLIFIHDGKVPFTISDVDNEEADTSDGTLGHINSITSVANSNKTSSEIGKFGVGFKAVFQYTLSPEVYDDNFSFRIENYIVPVQLDQCPFDRKRGETLFYFPFNKPKKLPEDAYSEIKEKLEGLVNPVLFLNTLRIIQWRHLSGKGAYRKNIREVKLYNDVKYEKIILLNVGGKSASMNLLLFTRELESAQLNRKYRVSVGFRVSSANEIQPLLSPAYCFFPTKETTNLNFLIQAPFLLTDSREGIKAGEAWNRSLAEQLAQLAKDSFRLLVTVGKEFGATLITDSIVKVIPYKFSFFQDLRNHDKLSFKPIFDAIFVLFKSAEILPAGGGLLVSRQNAYWASDTDLIDLFSDDQLVLITNNKNARWVFRTLGKKLVLVSDPELGTYIDGGDDRRGVQSNLIMSDMDPQKILRRIDAKFIEQQSITWLKKFYSYLLSRVALWNKNESLLRTKPIFLNRDSRAVSAYTEQNLITSKIFLPVVDAVTYESIHPGFVDDTDSMTFFANFGISHPELRNEIYNVVIPAFQNKKFTIESSEYVEAFKKLFTYFKQCPQIHLGSYIKDLKNIEFVRARITSGELLKEFCYSDYTYFFSSEVAEFIKDSGSDHFIDEEFYQSIIVAEDHLYLKEFFIKVGVNKLPYLDYEWEEITYSELRKHNLHDIAISSKYFDETELAIPFIHGFNEGAEEWSKSKSLMLWESLVEVFIHEKSDEFFNSLRGFLNYYPKHYSYSVTKYFETGLIKSLREQKWLYNQKGEQVAPCTINKEELHNQYQVDFKEASKFFTVLQIGFAGENLQLTELQRNAYELGRQLLLQGLNDKDLPEILELVGKHIEQKNKKADKSSQNGQSPIDKILETIKENVSNNNVTSEAQIQEENVEETVAKDSDDQIRYSVNVSNEIQKKQSQLELEIQHLAKQQELLDRVNAAKKYTFGWFKDLLELESSGTDRSSGKEVSISFLNVKLEETSSKILVLKEPSRGIPSVIEDIGDLVIQLHFVDETISVSAEVVSVKDYSLHAKLKSDQEIKEIDLKKVVRAVIDVKNPIFIFDEQRKSFNSLGFPEDYDMQANITSSIRFIFGPPGTGKTTYLAEKEILKIMKQGGKKVLVLTPTNKAADVLTMRIVEKADSSSRYFDWLLRYGTTGDERIDDLGILVDREFDIRTRPQNVVITTIARYFYDFFTTRQGDRLPIKDLQWDYIIVDEASMISLVSILVPLYKQTGCQFVIAGDPFQIQPIVSMDQWKDENIYTMVNLNSFNNATTIPHQFEIVKLKTQYRSLPAIGELFSWFSYDGTLAHHRDENSQKKFESQRLPLQPITIINFPVSHFESIYKPKSLNNSRYQVYSAIFSVEFLKYLSDCIARSKAKTFKIGVICPYKAQATLIEKLVSRQLAENVSCEIQVGTIHGFQGDECDMIITVFNPPPSISASENMFLNKKNILNVAISRAKDYLVILMPDDNTRNIDQLLRIKTLERLVSKHAAGDNVSYSAKEVERRIFNDASYIVNNTFSTTHQLVNVYTEAVKKYEVRCEESAIDVQIKEGEYGYHAKNVGESGTQVTGV